MLHARPPAMKSIRTTVSLTSEQLQSLQEMADMNGFICLLAYQTGRNFFV